MKMLRTSTSTLCVLLFSVLAQAQSGQLSLLLDDFESDLSRWHLSTGDSIAIVDSGDEAHENVLELRPAFSPVCALVKNSEEWSGIRVEGEFFFPTEGDSYFGLIYNHAAEETRTDFGCIYVKGNGSYIRVNPHLDGNPARALYEEYRVPLTDGVAVRDGIWFPFKAEVIGTTCHLYVVDLAEPRITFEHFSEDSGAIGFEARPIRGEPVWIDNVSVSSIENFSYTGPPIPERPRYHADDLLTAWEIMGPFKEPQTKLEKNFKKAAQSQWRSLDADPRGAILTGRVLQYRGVSKTAYARTNLANDAGRKVDVILNLATLDRLQVWLNGEFLQDAKPQRLAWHDFLTNPAHAGTSVPLTLRPGLNEIVLRIDGGKFAGGGFFAGIDVLE